MKNVVVYFGIMLFDESNAMCQRGISIAKSVCQLGYKPIMIGMSKKIRNSEVRERVINDIQCYEIEYPKNSIEWAHSILSAKQITDVLNLICTENIHSLIVADYRFLPTYQLMKYSQDHHINFIADIIDWFTSSGTLFSFIKEIDSTLRIKYLYPRVEKKICICSKYYELYEKNQTTVVIPGTIVPEDSIWESKKVIANADQESQLVLTFAGKPGKHCEKERIDWVIRAVNELQSEGKILFNIAGIEKEEFLKNNVDLQNLANSESVHFCGVISHEECVELIRKSDFSIIVREKSRLSEFGFSTKISESLACGTPVLATDTSDNRQYIHDGINGFVCDCKYDAVLEMIKHAQKLTGQEKLKMKKLSRETNPLIYSQYTDIIMKVL